MPRVCNTPDRSLTKEESLRIERIEKIPISVRDTSGIERGKGKFRRGFYGPKQQKRFLS